MKNKIEVLSLDVNSFGNQLRIFPVLIWNDEEATLIDTSFPGYFEQLKQAVKAVGVPFNKIKRVIITHQDWDHIGLMPDILDASGGQAEIWAHVDEKPYLEGSLPYIKMTPERMAARLQTIPEELRDKAAKAFASIPTAKVHRTLADGDILPIHGGIEVIHTPGHTPGHICLYLKSHRLLISGDELRVENGQLVGPAEMHTPDMPKALASLKKLTGYEVDTVICYHGGVYGPHASASIAKLATAI